MYQNAILHLIDWLSHSRDTGKYFGRIYEKPKRNSLSRDSKIIHIWLLVPVTYYCLNRTATKVMCPFLAVYFLLFQWQHLWRDRYCS